jgi:molybdate transport system regulatory protein
MEKIHHEIEVRGSVWITVNGKSFGGKGRIELLSRIAERGSISQAAKDMKMSYKAAWNAVDEMNTLVGEALVERSVGGKGGGGAKLTPCGEYFVKTFSTIAVAQREFLATVNQQLK